MGMTNTKKHRGPVCECNAYRFPHREGGGKCEADAPAEDAEEDSPDCNSCRGTGIGWGGPDSRCGTCGGSGMPRKTREDPDDAYDRLWDR